MEPKNNSAIRNLEPRESNKVTSENRQILTFESCQVQKVTAFCQAKELPLSNPTESLRNNVRLNNQLTVPISNINKKFGQHGQDSSLTLVGTRGFGQVFSL